MIQVQREIKKKGRDHETHNSATIGTINSKVGQIEHGGSGKDQMPRVRDAKLNKGGIVCERLHVWGRNNLENRLRISKKRRREKRKGEKRKKSNNDGPLGK